MKTSNRVPVILAMCFVMVAHVAAQHAPDSDEKLASDFWAWRARTAQYTNDDITRMERPAGVMRDWSAASVEKQRQDLTDFEERWKKLGDKEAPVWKQVDHRLLASGLARVRWELDVLDRWQRDPNFYIDQTLTPVGEALTVPGPYNEGQSREILTRIEQHPSDPARSEAESFLASSTECPNGDRVAGRHSAKAGNNGKHADVAYNGSRCNLACLGVRGCDLPGTLQSVARKDPAKPSRAGGHRT